MNHYEYNELPPLHIFLVKEEEVRPENHAAIQKLLVNAFPQYEDIFGKSSYWGARPTHRLWMEMESGEIIAHLDFEPRKVRVGTNTILIAGIGEVATHPGFHHRGLGRRLMNELDKILRTIIPVEFGYLQCRPAVLGFYTRVGWHLVTNKVQYIDPDTGSLTIDKESHSVVLPALSAIHRWPKGLIDLLGMPW
ncbi:GNAT family N-acetyltransferase [Legionella sp.]|uniref:GNAT family N-acetyltransferase n=1 Tax=Legionella sp. TaxID=459 RepID=UPI000CC6E4AF|nr:GNAT family N-acetyltransferase [Legionella sp.]PJE05777.1 MAG: hypothetical protein CK430_15285 [Legionella sp.]